MVITEDVPGAYPVSDWSASSSSAEGAEEFVRSSRPLHARLRFNSDATSSSIPGVVLETSLCCQDTEPSSPMPHDRSQKHVTFGNLEVRKYPVILGGKMRSLPKMQNFSLWYVLYSWHFLSLTSTFNFQLNRQPRVFTRATDFYWMGSL